MIGVTAIDTMGYAGALTDTKGWRDFIEVAEVIVATGGAGSLLVGLIEVGRSTISGQRGRYGDMVAYGFLVGGTGGLVVEGLAKLGIG
jgi:hypothetical protein